MKTRDRLAEGAQDVASEWRAVVKIASSLESVRGPRSFDQSALLDAGMLHYRCIVNFCCGNFKGKWMSNDLKPQDFLGRPWWPEDNEFDRRLRGRLATINKALVHLSWQRLDLYTMWPFDLLAHEADHALRRFLDQIPVDATWAPTLQDAGEFARVTLPPKPRRGWASSVVEQAPVR